MSKSHFYEKHYHENRPVGGLTGREWVAEMLKRHESGEDIGEAILKMCNQLSAHWSKKQ